MNRYYTVYDDHQKSDEEFGRPEDALAQILFKLVGGRSEDDVATVIGESESVGQEQLDRVLEDLDLESLPTGERESIQKMVADSKRKLSESLAGLASTLSENIPDSKGYNVIRKLRELGLNSEYFKQKRIKPPNVIPQIYEALKDVDDFSSLNLSFDTLFGKEAWQQWFGNNPGIVAEINGFYNLLNTIGYYADRQQHKERKFVAMMSDHGHAGYAAFAHKLLSRDERFVKKTEAVYEHLGITTDVVLLPS